MKNNKGAALILEQIFIIVFGIILLVLVMTVFSNLRQDTYDFIAEQQFESIGGYVHGGVIQAYNRMGYSSYGKIQLYLPATVGGHAYHVYLNSTEVKVEEISKYLNRTETVLSLDSNIQIYGNVSSTSGGRHFIIYNTSAPFIKLETEFSS